MAELNPVENPKLTTRKEILHLLGWFFIIMITINGLCFWYFKYYDHRDWKFLAHLKWDLLKKLNGKTDWLILGDSSGNQSVQTDPFEKELGEKAVNLCTIGPMLTLNDSWMLDYYIKHYGKPDNVMIMHVYDMWHRDIDFETISENPMHTVMLEDLQPGLDVPAWRKADLFVHNFVPVYYRHHALKALFTGEAKWFSTPIELEPNGYNPRREAMPDNVKKDTENHIKFTQDSLFRCGAYVRKGLDHVRELVDKYGFELYITMSPLHDSLYANPAFRKYCAGIDKLVQEFAAGNKHIHIINHPPKLFPANEMQNSDHIIDRVSGEFTRYLIGEVKKVRSGQVSPPGGSSP
ncbi:MAG: hypothetical protein FD123_3458 [Bacteroidetes bacterium]|nr:MAG: hypothetical protein FD123_3458 [Bacteroidota bacterium]